MYYSKKNKILGNKFNTVENLAKEIYKENQEKMEFDVIDPNSHTKRIEMTLFQQIVQNVMPRKTVMCVDIYDIRYKDEIMNLKRIQREGYALEPFEVDKIRKAVSPQPKITLMGFSKDAFFNRRKGILKPWLKLRKVNIFTDLSKNLAGYLSKNNERKVREIANGSIDKRKTMMVQNQNYTNIRLNSPNSYANRKDSNEVNKQSKKL